MGGHQAGRPALHDKGADAVSFVVARVVGDDVQVLDAGVRQGTAEFIGGAHIGEPAQHDGHAVMAFGQGLVQCGDLGSWHFFVPSFFSCSDGAVPR